MRGDTSTADDRPDHTVAVLGYGRLREVTERLAELDGVRSFIPSGEPDPTSTHGSASVERRSAADGGVLTEPVDQAIEFAPVTLVTTDLPTAGSTPLQALERIAETETTGIAIVALPIEGEPAGQRPHEHMDRIRDAAEVTVVLRGDDREQDLRAIATALVDIMATAGYVNLDLADVRTVLSAGPYASIASGTADPDVDATEQPIVAVDMALDAFSPGSVDANLIYLVGGPEMTLEAGMAAVEALTERTGDSPSIIWGAAIEEQRQTVTAHVVSGIDDDTWLDADLDAAAALTPGDPCPRCGGRVVAYSFGDNETQACDDCGYTGIAASRG